MTTTQHMVADIEALRELHDVDRWLVFGGSWGSTLGLAYAVEHSTRVSDDAVLRDRAARSWCAWEERLATLSGPPTPSGRYGDPTFRLGFARLVTHLFGQHAFLSPDGISARIGNLADVPAVFVRGRLTAEPTPPTSSSSRRRTASQTDRPRRLVLRTRCAEPRSARTVER